MKFYNFIIRYRFWLGLLAIVLGVVANFTVDIWTAVLLYFLAFIALLSHFLIGPIRLLQKPIEEGNIEEVNKILNSIWFPNLLIKPIRSSYYTLKANMDMAQQNFSSAEKNLKKSVSLGGVTSEMDAANNLQMGMMALQRNDFKEGEKYVKAAIRGGLPDKDSQAMAYLAMSQIYLREGK
jgi:tetratricopeptide (TPR) repeat protein